MYNKSISFWFLLQINYVYKSKQFLKQYKLEYFVHTILFSKSHHLQNLLFTLTFQTFLNNGTLIIWLIFK